MSDRVESPRLAPMLKPGDLVRLVSPGSRPTEAGVEAAVGVLESWGLRVDRGDHVFASHGFMAGTDGERIDDLNAAFRDPHVRAIVTTRGGAGSYRIADRLDFDAIRADPKPLVGFSDITNLHMALWSRTRLVTVHGCVDGTEVSVDVRRLLMSTEPYEIGARSDVLTAALVVGGKAEGPLLGGNLREVAGAVGAGLPDLRGAIVFLEDLRHRGLGQVDRNLTQLLRSGALDGIAGIALGLFDGFANYTDQGWTLLDVLHERLGDLGVPMLGGLPVGHGGTDAAGRPDQRALALGQTATLDADARTLAVGPGVR